MLARPGGGEDPQPRALPRADHLERRDRPHGGADPARLDLDHDQLAAVERDDVELAAHGVGPRVARDDPPAAALELARHDPLGVAAQSLAAHRHGSTLGGRDSPVAREVRRIRRTGCATCGALARSVVAVLASVRTYALMGVEARDVTVEVDVSAGLPSFAVVGLPDAAVRESRERVRAAIVELRLRLPAAADHRQPRARRPAQGRPRIRPGDRGCAARCVRAAAGRRSGGLRAGGRACARRPPAPGPRGAGDGRARGGRRGRADRGGARERVRGGAARRSRRAERARRADRAPRGPAAARDGRGASAPAGGAAPRRRRRCGRRPRRPPRAARPARGARGGGRGRRTAC